MSQIKQRFDLVAARKYITRGGEEKTQWSNHGRAVEWEDGGMEIELTSLPVFPGWNGKLKLFVQKDRQAPAQQRQSPKPAQHDGFEDDSIPF